MITIRQLSSQPGEPWTSLTLPYESRQKSRLKTCLDNGSNAAILLPRGSIMRDGDRLLADSGEIIEVRAALETVSTVTASSSLMLTRAAYHLGNRHVPLQVGGPWLRYQHDHVLDEMVKQLGAGVEVDVGQASFEPEAGAYGHGHKHGHEHEHGDSGHHQHSHTT